MKHRYKYNWHYKRWVLLLPKKQKWCNRIILIIWTIFWVVLIPCSEILK